jgi:hypothetical protein
MAQLYQAFISALMFTSFPVPAVHIVALHYSDLRDPAMAGALKLIKVTCHFQINDTDLTPLPHSDSGLIGSPAS